MDVDPNHCCEPDCASDRSSARFGGDRDTLSIKAYQALAAALELRSDRKVVLSDTGNFPSDLYIARGLLNTIDAGHRLVTPEPDEVFDNINEEVAVVYLTHVDYRTGRMHDMEAITHKAHECGATTLWDLAHSAGALPLAMHEVQSEFAVGMHLQVSSMEVPVPRHSYMFDLTSSADVKPALAGWMGHQSPFAMDSGLRSCRQHRAISHRYACYRSVQDFATRHGTLGVCRFERNSFRIAQFERTIYRRGGA